MADDYMFSVENSSKTSLSWLLLKLGKAKPRSPRAKFARKKSLEDPDSVWWKAARRKASFLVLWCWLNKIKIQKRGNPDPLKKAMKYFTALEDNGLCENRVV